MEDIALRWIKEVGFPIFVSAMAMWAMYKLFRMREDDRNNKESTMSKALNENSMRLDRNTESVDTLTTYMEKFGSDPAKLCKAVDLESLINRKLHELNILRTRMNDLEKLAKIPSVPKA